MAAGKRVSWRNYGYRDRESDLEVARRGFVYSGGEYGRIGNGNGESDRVWAQDVGHKGRVRLKDIMEREVVNGGNRSSSSRSDMGSSGGGHLSGPRGIGVLVRARGREPGELSSESGGSDDVIDFKLKSNKASEVVKLVENGALDFEKKRKFSPIVWDRDDKEVVSSSHNCISQAGVSLSPFLLNIDNQSDNDQPYGGPDASPTKSSNDQDLKSSLPFKVTGPLLFPVYSESDSLEGLASLVPEEQLFDDGGGPDQTKDEDYLPTQNISSSRWAEGNNSPVDEGEIVEGRQTPKRRKKMPLMEPIIWNKSSTPEFGDLKREGLDRVSEMSSDERYLKSLSGDDYSGHGSNNYDFMDVDEEHDNSDGAVGDSGGENDHQEAPEDAGLPHRNINMLSGCRSVDEFERLNKINEGTYGVLYRAKDKKTGEIVALKKVKMEKEREGFPLTSLREINILLSFHHPSIVDVEEVVVGSNLDSIFMVMEYMEHDLKGLMESMK